MTDPISQYGRLSQSDSAVRGSAEKVGKKSNVPAGSSSGQAESSERSAPVRQEDTIALSQIDQKVKAEPDFDRAKVEAIKQAIAEGQYPLNPKRIAESFVALERMIRE
jgi:negative regulator of flagellin synthesis FlgM